MIEKNGQVRLKIVGLKHQATQIVSLLLIFLCDDVHTLWWRALLTNCFVSVLSRSNEQNAVGTIKEDYLGQIQ